MTTFFTSDTHFGHSGMLSDRMHRPRPYASREAMDEALVGFWNNRIRDDDTVYHLGDFAYGCSQAYAEDVFRRLNGKKHLVIGNHEQRGLALNWAAPPIQAGMVHIQDCQTALNIDPGSASNFDPLVGYGGTPLISPAKRVGVAQPG